MNNSGQHYRLQIALRSGSGFELVTVMTEPEFVKEINNARQESRFARVASENPDLATCSFRPDSVDGYQHTPVSRVARVQQ